MPTVHWSTKLKDIVLNKKVSCQTAYGQGVKIRKASTVSHRNRKMKNLKLDFRTSKMKMTQVNLQHS